MDYIAIGKEIREHLDSVTSKMTDEQALDNIVLFEGWSGERIQYKRGKRLQDEGVLYEVIQDHTSQNDWKPADVPALYKVISIDEYPEWRQPQGAHDAYRKGAKCSHNSKHWVSDYDANNYEPGVFGWHEVE